MLRSKVALRVQRLKASPQWDSIGKDIEANLGFIYRNGDKQIDELVDKKIKRSRGRSKKQQREDPRPAPVPKTETGRHGTGFACKLAPIVYDNTRIKHHLEGNRLLQALVESTPGLRAHTEPEVDGSDNGLGTMGTLAQALALDFGNSEESDSDSDDEEKIEEQAKASDAGDDDDYDLFCQNLSFDSMTKQLEAMMLEPDHATSLPDFTPYKPPEDEEMVGYGSEDMDMSD